MGATGQRTLVHLGWVPGLEAPDRLWASLADGRVLDAEHISAVIQVPDLTLADSATEFKLANQPWQAIMREGYFGVDGRGWER